VRCIFESIGVLYDIHHGVAKAMFLPNFLDYNLPAYTRKLGVLARTTFIDTVSDDQAARSFIQIIKDQNIGSDQFSLIADMSFKNNSNASDPRDLVLPTS
jgi:alcohol dehydrogenase